jgi:hypothetical protein
MVDACWPFCIPKQIYLCADTDAGKTTALIQVAARILMRPNKLVGFMVGGMGWSDRPRNSFAGKVNREVSVKVATLEYRPWNVSFYNGSRLVWLDYIHPPKVLPFDALILDDYNNASPLVYESVIRHKEANPNMSIFAAGSRWGFAMRPWNTPYYVPEYASIRVTRQGLPIRTSFPRDCGAETPASLSVTRRAA